MDKEDRINWLCKEINLYLETNTIEDLSRLLDKQLPKNMITRISSKLYRIREKKDNEM